MSEREFIEYLDGHRITYEYAYGKLDEAYGIYIKNKRFDTEIHIAIATIEVLELDDLIRATYCGKNVEQITRVTGFFSKASGWNKGKRGELTDRYRSDIG